MSSGQREKLSGKGSKAGALTPWSVTMSTPGFSKPSEVAPVVSVGRRCQ